MQRKLSLILAAIMLLGLSSCGYKLVKIDANESTTSASISTQPEPEEVTIPEVSLLNFTELTDSETSDMPTFYIENWPYETMTAIDVEAFVAAYGGQDVRFVGLYFDESVKDGYYKSVHNHIEYFDANADWYDGLEVSDNKYMISGTVDPNITDIIRITGENTELIFMNPYIDEWWKDDYESDWPDSDILPEDAYTPVDAKTVGDNITRAEYNYKDTYISLYNVKVFSVEPDYVHVMCTTPGVTASYYFCYYSDFTDSGAIELNKDDYVTVYGYCTGAGFFNDGLDLEKCWFIKDNVQPNSGSGYNDSVYGTLNDAFSDTMDAIYGNGWRELLY